MSQGSQQGVQGQNSSSSAPPVVASSAGQTSTAQSTSVTTATGGGQPSVAVSSVGGGQPSVAAAPPVQAGVQQTANPMMSLKPLGSSKPPKFDDTFEVYQLRLRLYLQQRDSWKVVTGEEVRHPDNQVLQRQFDDRNSLAMETIIRGVKGDDAQKVCVYESAKEMWDTLVAEKTQRDFSYAVHLKREIYMHAYKPGQKMADYIQEMNSLRQRLQHMGPSFIIDDTSMSQLLLMGVCAVHREIVTQFDFSYRQGNPPTLQQVKNALLSRDEMDKMAADTAGNSGVTGNGERVVMHMQSPNSGGKPGQGQPQTGQVQTTGAGKQRLKRCYHCKKLGHLRRDCWFYKNKQNKVKGKNGGGGQGSKEKGKKGGKGGSDDSTKSDKPTTGAMGYMRFISHAGEPSESSSSENEEFVGMAIKSDRRSPDGDWMLDSGTTSHVCIERDLFTSIKKSKSAFKVWDGGVTRGELCGSVVIPVMDAVTRKSMTLMLDKVEFSSSGPVNLISMGRMLKSGWTVSSSPENELPVKMVLTRGNQRLEFIFHGEHFWLNNGSFGETSAVVMATVNADGGPLMRWHERLAHLNEAALKFMVKHDVVAGMDISEEQLKTKLKCLSCMSAKRKRKSYGNATDKRTTVSFERLTSDVCDMGAYLPGIGVSRYFQLIHDEGSRYKWCYIIGKKSEASGNMQRLIAELLAQGKLIKKFTSDGGGEYVNTELKEFLKSKGIVFIPTHSYTPEENCLVEKMNGVLVNKMRAVMHAANLPSVLWPEVLQYVVEVDNLSPTKALKGLTPTEKLTGSKPNIEGLKVCGCVAYVFVPKETRKNKLSAKAEPALFLGLPKTGHGYRLLHLRTGKMVEARDVKFREDVTVERTYVNALLKGRQNYYPQIPFVPLPVEYVADQSVRAGAVDSVRAAMNDITGTELTDNRHVHVEDEQPRQECQDDRVVADLVGDVSADSVGDASNESMNDNELMPTTDRLRPWSQRHGNKKSADNQPRRSSKRLRGLRRSERQKKANVRLKDYIMASVEAMEELSGNPASAEEALNSPQRDKWLDAMRLEMDAHRVNGTWRLVDRPKQPCNILKTTWVLRVKLNEKGKVDRRKGRLTVCGYGQKYGVDYVDTYSPVVRIETVRMVLILAFLLDLDCCHVDFVTAFLNGELKGVKIYMEQPEYFDDGSGRVCELLKGLYGLKQASRLWYQTLHKHLLDIGFTQCDFDVGLYQHWKDGRVVYVTVYVDDLLIAAKKEDIEQVIEDLSNKFALKNLGRVKHILGMEVKFMPGEVLCISQTAYIDRVLERFGMRDCRPLGSPLMQNEYLPPIETDERKINDPNVPYRELIGALQYLVACTRPDLANAVRSLSRYCGAYTMENYLCAKRVLRYLQGTRTFGLVYRRTSRVLPIKIDGYSDADHANCPDTSRSVTGYLLRLNGCTFLYKSKQQAKVTTATCSSELIAASACVDDMIWARKLLKEIRGESPPCSKLFMDNQSTIMVATEPGNYKKMKRFAKLSREIAEFVKKDKVQVEYVPSAENVADIFTKALGPQRFQGLRQALNVEDVSTAIPVQHE